MFLRSHRSYVGHQVWRLHLLSAKLWLIIIKIYFFHWAFMVLIFTLCLPSLSLLWSKSSSSLVRIIAEVSHVHAQSCFSLVHLSHCSQIKFIKCAQDIHNSKAYHRSLNIPECSDIVFSSHWPIEITRQNDTSFAERSVFPDRRIIFIVNYGIKLVLGKKMRAENL